MKKIITLSTATLACLSLVACGNSNNKKSSSTSSTTQATKSKYYFDGKTANLHDIKIHIDKVSYYKADEMNDKDVICFDYTITNKTDKDIDALTGWQSVFNAYQDNKNTEGKLDVAAMPSDTSDQILHNQDQTIKKGGSVKCRTAYELGSTSKPVVLKATQGVDGKFLGKKTYKLKNLKTPNSESTDSDNDSARVSNKTTKISETSGKGQKRDAKEEEAAKAMRDYDPEWWDSLSPEEQQYWAHHTAYGSNEDFMYEPNLYARHASPVFGGSDNQNNSGSVDYGGNSQSGDVGSTNGNSGPSGQQ